MALALASEVSTRHLSWLETGKSQPSRAMVLRLAEQLDVPLRERNALLQAAGYAPLFPIRTLDDPGLSVAKDLLQRLLTAYEPSPALVVDHHWNLVAHNRLVPLLLASVPERWVQPPVNVLRLSLHPEGLAPMIVNFGRWRAYVLQRLNNQCVATGDPELHRLLDELRGLPSARTEPIADENAAVPDDVAVPLSLLTPVGRLNFITTVTVFGAPRDVTLSELAIETLLPADRQTAATLRRVVDQLPAPPNDTPLAT